jgi:hypothetical protein
LRWKDVEDHDHASCVHELILGTKALEREYPRHRMVQAHEWAYGTSKVFERCPKGRPISVSMFLESLNSA